MSPEFRPIVRSSSEALEFLKSLGLCDEELADFTEVSIATVRRWRTTKSGPLHLRERKLIRQAATLADFVMAETDATGENIVDFLRTPTVDQNSHHMSTYLEEIKKGSIKPVIDEALSHFLNIER
jgi:hypothetical protein